MNTRLSMAADKHGIVVPSSLGGQTPYLVTVGMIGTVAILAVVTVFAFLPEADHLGALAAIGGLVSTLTGIVVPLIKGQQDLAKLNLTLALAQIEHTDDLKSSTDNLKLAVDGQSDQLKAAARRADYAEGRLAETTTDPLRPIETPTGHVDEGPNPPSEKRTGGTGVVEVKTTIKSDTPIHAALDEELRQSQNKIAAEGEAAVKKAKEG